jgi:hypothetical protein
LFPGGSSTATAGGKTAAVRTDADPHIEIFDFIESYYNYHLKDSVGGYQSPGRFETKTTANN